MSDEAVDLGGEMQLLVKTAMATERGRRDDVVEERKKNDEDDDRRSIQ